ncbi:MAG: hypothetical protein C4584_01515 [Armatimonadetes bacterium]|nr:MAG: hypothetical protein C4584_01515 [Armatimonadota bacterium]
MLNLTRRTLDKIKKSLSRTQKDVKKQLQSIEENDPVTEASLVAESPESGTESWLADAHSRISSLKTDLLQLSSRIKISLANLRKGTYGKCESCGKMIEPDRLEAMPTASLCLSCSGNPKKNTK